MCELFLLAIIARGEATGDFMRLFGLYIGVFCGVVVQSAWVGDRRLATSR
jgi:hypothetical protein